MSQKSYTRKRRHHYVWRRYLRAWATDEKIHTLIDGRRLNPNLMGVAQRRDFYEFCDLTNDDVTFIRMLVVERAMPHLKAMHEDTLRNYLLVQKALEISGKYAGKDLQLDAHSAAMRSNFIEDWHSAIETAADPYLEALANGDVTFYQDKTACIDFSTYLATQYMRTNKRRNGVIGLNSPIDPAMVERTWTLVAHMLAANIAWHLFATRNENTIKLLINNTDCDFITTDQPVINILVNPGEVGVIPGDAEFYYPITPRFAILLGKHDKYPGTENSVSPELVDWLNTQMVLQSDSQIFSRNRVTLDPYASLET